MDVYSKTIHLIPIVRPWGLGSPTVKDRIGRTKVSVERVHGVRLGEFGNQAGMAQKEIPNEGR